MESIEDLEYGELRSERTEELVERAERIGMPNILIMSLQQLVEAYAFGGRDARLLVPFSRVLTRWQERPEEFDASTRSTLLRQFKWAPARLWSRPEVPLARVEELLDSMRDLYAEAGYSQRPVHLARTALLDHLGHADEARRAADDAGAAPRDELADCEACERSAT